MLCFISAFSLVQKQYIINEFPEPKLKRKMKIIGIQKNAEIYTKSIAKYITVCFNVKFSKS